MVRFLVCGSLCLLVVQCIGVFIRLAVGKYLPSDPPLAGSPGAGEIAPKAGALPEDDTKEKKGCSIW